ncbi:MAG: preprotein translocase subunit YajC [Desulfobacterales bacterium]|nr:preprotein translocase subunit YajC [Desulfobacterales bacterium]
MGQGAATSTAPSGGGFTAFVPLILMFVIFYFLLIRPQQKKAKEQQQMINSIKKGDRILTTGGIHGRVTGLDENTLTVEIADKVRIKLVRSAVSTLLTSPPSQSNSNVNTDQQSVTTNEK